MLPPQNTLAICMQIELFVTVYVALLGLFNGGSFAPNDERILGIILTVTTTFCLLFGLAIVAVAMCKLNPDEPWAAAVRRSLSMAGPASVPDSGMGVELMDQPNPSTVGDLEMGGSSAAESPSEIAKRLNAENGSLKQEIDRLEADNQNMHQDNEDLRHVIEALRLSSALNQSGGAGDPGDEAVTTVTEALVEAPASAEDIELQATTGQQSKTTSASQPEVDEDALNKMLSMGLQREYCVLALRRCGGDTNAATEFGLRPKF